MLQLQRMEVKSYMQVLLDELSCTASLQSHCSSVFSINNNENENENDNEDKTITKLKRICLNFHI